MSVYILKLEHDKYYVGHTEGSVAKRFQQHVANKGSEWTRTHKPIEIYDSFAGDCFDEEKHTLITMHRFGIDNVRGGSYSTLVLSKSSKSKAGQQIRSVLKLCYRCGRGGHMTSACPRDSKTTKKWTNETNTHSHVDESDDLYHFKMGCEYDSDTGMYIDDEGRFHDI